MPDAMPAGRAAVLAALLRIYAAQGRVTVRQIAEACGCSTATCHWHLVRLRRAGLVAWQDGAAGTLRPTVEVRAVA